MSATAERRLEEKERRKTDILDAAESVAGSAGFAALTMDDVARKARLSRALLYVYFHDKGDLLLGLCLRALDVLHARFVAAVGSRDLGRDQLEAVGRAYVAFAAECPVYFEALAEFELHPPDAAEPSATESACIASGDQVHGLMVSCIERGIADGSIRADVGPPLLVALTLWAFMHGTIQLARTKKHVIAHDGFEVRQLIDHALFLATRSLYGGEPGPLGTHCDG